MPASATQIKVPPPTESEVPAAFKAKVLPYQGQSPLLPSRSGSRRCHHPNFSNSQTIKDPPKSAPY